MPLARTEFCGVNYEKIVDEWVEQTAAGKSPRIVISRASASLVMDGKIYSMPNFVPREFDNIDYVIVLPGNNESYSVEGNILTCGNVFAAESVMLLSNELRFYNGKTLINSDAEEELGKKGIGVIKVKDSVVVSRPYSMLSKDAMLLGVDVIE